MNDSTNEGPPGFRSVYEERFSFALPRALRSRYVSLLHCFRAGFLNALSHPVQGIQLPTRRGTLVANGREASDVVL